MVDLMRVVMAVLVVALHGQFLNDLSRSGNFVVSDVISRLAVPWFFVVAGYYFRADTLTLLIPWVKRLALLFAVWMLVYFPLYFDTLTARRTLSFSLAGYWHLWFLIAMLEAGILLYFIKRFRVSLGFALAVILYSTGLIIQFYQINYAGNDLNAYRNFLFFALPFMLVGQTLRRMQPIAISNSTIVCASLGSLAALLLEATIIQIGFGYVQDMYLMLFFAAPLLFMACLRYDTGRWHFAAQVATGIYLIHPMLIHLLKMTTGFEYTSRSLLAALGAAVIAALLTRLNKVFPVL